MSSESPYSRSLVGYRLLDVTKILRQACSRLQSAPSEIG